MNNPFDEFYHDHCYPALYRRQPPISNFSMAKINPYSQGKQKKSNFVLNTKLLLKNHTIILSEFQPRHKTGIFHDLAKQNISHAGYC